MRVQIRDEIVARAPTKVGLLAEFTEAIAEAEIDIYAIGAYDKQGFGEFMLITSDNDAAAQLLKSLGAEIGRNDVVVLNAENRPGSLAVASDILATAGINVDWVYATAGGGSDTTVILRTGDPKAALAALQE